MKSKYKMAIAVWLFIIAIIYLASLSRDVAVTGDTLIRLALFTIIVGGTIYKLTLWVRYRSDPEKRERVVFSSQVYPERLRRMLMDEEGEKHRIICRCNLDECPLRSFSLRAALSSSHSNLTTMLRTQTRRGEVALKPRLEDNPSALG